MSKSASFATLLIFIVSCNALQTSGPSCNVSHPSEGLNATIPCAANSTATLEQAKALAWTYAPVVHFHPLEPYYLQDFEVFYDNAQLYLTDYQNATSSSSDYAFVLEDPYTELTLGPRTFITLLNSTILSPEEYSQLLAGAPFDAKNHSTAKVYYTVNDYNDALWTFNYNFFYSWNGCSNQAITILLNGTKTVTNYLMCPPGVHEADLERVSMLVCKSDLQIKRIAYSQHSWVEERDCTQPGQCPLDPETGHPVTHAGLEGHGNYPEVSPLMVYEYIKLEVNGTVSLDNLGGYYIGDRTLVDPYKKWVPREDNVVYLPPSEDIIKQNLTEFNWALYPGNWGAPLSLPAGQLICISDDEFSKYPCDPNDQNIQIIRQALSVVSLPALDLGIVPFGSGTGYNITTPKPGEKVSYPDISGPLFRGFNYFFDNDGQAPVLSQNLSMLICPDDAQPDDALPPPPTSSVGVDTVVNYLIGIAVGDVAFSILLIIMLALPMILSKKTRVQQMVVRTARKIKPTKAMGVLRFKSKTKSAADAPGYTLAGETDTDVDVPLEKEQQQQQQQAIDAPIESLSSLTGSAIDHEEISGDSDNELVHGTLQPADMDMFGGTTIVWAVLAGSLYIAGVVTVSLGIVYVFDNSILSVAIEVLGITSVANTIKALLILGLILFFVCDFIALFLVFFLRPRYLTIYKWTFRNYLGGNSTLMRHTFSMHVIAVGLMLLVINVSVIMFALGILILFAQVAARVACDEAFSITALGFSVQNICISVPLITEEQICGYEAQQTCFEVTEMRVWIVALGSLFLLWSHLCWLILIVFSMIQQRKYEIVATEEVKPEEHELA